MRRLLSMLLLTGSGLGLAGCVVAPGDPGHHGGPPPPAAYHAPAPAYGSAGGHHPYY